MTFLSTTEAVEDILDNWNSCFQGTQEHQNKWCKLKVILATVVKMKKKDGIKKIGFNKRGNDSTSSEEEKFQEICWLQLIFLKRNFRK